MPGKTAIEWTDVTWNPVTGCTLVTAGCDFCYAKRLHDRRHAAYLAGEPLPPQYAEPFERVRVHPDRLAAPLAWKTPRRIFVNSVSDLWHADVPDAFIAAVFAVMAATPQHTYQVLTKRPQRMRRLVTDPAFRAQVAAAWPAGLVGQRIAWPLPNVWLGVSVERQDVAWRLDLLAGTPAAVRFVSAEPLLGPLDLRPWLAAGTLDWVITGGESGGPPERALVRREGTRWAPKGEALAWVRAIRDQCRKTGTPFFFKQWGGPKPDAGGRLLDDREWNEYPEAT